MLAPKVNWLLVLLLTSILFCRSRTATDIVPSWNSQDSLLVKLPEVLPSTFNYDLENPALRFNMPLELKEISGLSFNNKDGALYTHNDESGTFYKLSAETGEILQRYSFAGLGDFEGIEVINGTVYITENKGNLWTYNLETQKSTGVIKTALTGANDVEGLGYDNSKNALLLACKGKNTAGKNIPGDLGHKSFYNLSLRDTSLALYGTINIDTIKEFALKFGDISEKKLEKRLQRAREFAPSAIAIHPLTGEIYILSSVGNTLVVINQALVMIHLDFLKDGLFNQPEGICFDPSGRLFISNEGDELSSGQIVAFNPISH